MNQQSLPNLQSDLDILPGNNTFRCVCQRPPGVESCGGEKTCNTTGFCITEYTPYIKDGQVRKHTNKGCDNDRRKCLSKTSSYQAICCEEDLCNDGNDPIGSVNPIDKAVTVTLLSVAVILVVIITLICRRRKAKKLADRQLEDIEMAYEVTCGTSGGSGGQMELQQQTIAKKVTIQERIGQGRYGDVWRGTYHGETVAIKIFNSVDEESWNRENMIYSTLMLRHENILVFLGADIYSRRSKTEMWLIVQYHPKGSLYDYLNDHRLSLTDTIRLALTACMGLAHLHEGVWGKFTKPGIAHRDIKSKNILVKNDHTCCIADFGLALTYDKDTNFANQNTRVGTKRYMAPEILDGTIQHEEFDSFKMADVYAFALVLWEVAKRCLIQGVCDDYEIPYEGMVSRDPSFEEMSSVVSEQDRRPPIPDRWNQEEITMKYSQLVSECWRKRPSSRLTILRVKKTLVQFSNDAMDEKQALPSADTT